MKARGATGFISAVVTLPMFNSVHGIWGAASQKTRPGTLYGASWGTAADLSFTMPAVVQGVRGHLVGVGSGVGEMIATAPQIAVATPTAIRESGTERTAWYALDGWAAALFVHGAVSTAVGAIEDDIAPPPPEPPPPPPEPTPTGPLEIEPPEPAPKPTGRFIVPGTVSLRPMALPGGAGVSFGAVLW